jgi:hypothetical protein
VATFDYYGLRGDDLEAARALVERALAIALERHESTFWGGDYYRADFDDLRWNIELKRNYNRFTQALNEERYPEMAMIVYVNRAPDPDAIRARLATVPEIVHLDRRVVEPPPKKGTR